MRNGSLFLSAAFAVRASEASAETGFTKDGTVLRFEIEQGGYRGGGDENRR